MTPHGAASPSLRILVVNWLDRENPRAGGAEEHLHEIFGRLASYGHEVTALVSGWPGCAPRATLDGIEVHRAGRRHTFSLAAPRYFRRHLRSRDFDVVVEDLNKIPLYAARWTRAPVALLVHHLFGTTAFQAASAPVAAVTWLLERTIPRMYRGLPWVAVSDSTREDMVARGLNPSGAEVVPNGVDVERYTVGSAEDRARAPTVLFLGRLKRYKRVDLLIDAIALLAERGLRVELRVGGQGEESDRLAAHARSRGVADRVSVLGYIPEEDKVSELRGAWIHGLTSVKEGWGISNLEAAACGTPSVASDAPGLRESVVHEETGLLVPHEDVGALADAIQRLVVDGQLRASMGNAARAFAERYSWDAAARSMERVLTRVVEASRPG